MLMISICFTTSSLTLNINKFIDSSTKFTYNKCDLLDSLTKISACTEFTCP